LVGTDPSAVIEAYWRIDVSSIEVDGACKSPLAGTMKKTVMTAYAAHRTTRIIATPRGEDMATA
jgi:hypothetical protein